MYLYVQNQTNTSQKYVLPTIRKLFGVMSLLQRMIVYPMDVLTYEIRWMHSVPTATGAC